MVSFVIYVWLFLFPLTHVQVDIRVSPGSHADEDSGKEVI